ncbi:uncharacterized protein BT62DRAFT_278025 [Guyanagaster necrorhizus]|uniref:Mid2 domain-containing protein n=1 Tax=Guyanagaster necrorhizus TaxID=856835 RepID=A0A9P7W6B0_9AGAR|nr:uncharacterized protein BT62DRAFT_278025 [Guyanagaster necrorhizus MCA 3950]KAG7452051.1 hypothetical protein BT62DRAFT_278025 [Guyanagaster necrorhizus MCA 3950]
MAGYVNNTYDDRLTNVLKYAGSWFNTGSYNASNVGETGTLSSSKDPAANVTFTFPVPANAFYYYGIRRCCGGLYAICIDCDPNNPNFELIDALNRSDDGKNPPVILYTKSFDQLGIHEIILTNQNDTRFGGNSQITLDRFELQVQNNNAQLPSESSASTSQTTSSIAATSSTAPAASQSATTSSSTSKLPIAAIIGGVAGSIAAISLCIAIWYFMRRRHRTQPGRNDPIMSFYTSSHQSSPFILPYTKSHTPTAYTVSDTTSGSTSREVNRASVAAGPSALNASSGRAHTPSSRMASSERRPRRATDAGRIDVDDDGDSIATLPPEYEEVFSSERLNGEQPVTGVRRRGSSRRETRRPQSESEPSRVIGQPSSQPIKF